MFDLNLSLFIGYKTVKYLISHHDHTGGYLTPIFKTAEETAVYFGLTRKTIERWEKKPDFPFDGQIYDTWAICCWLNENEKLYENWEIIKSKKFQKGK